MKLRVNGELKDIKENITVTEILEVEKVEAPDMVSVQLNGEFVDREKFSDTILKENDEIDFLYFMGGGSIGL